MNNSSAVNNDAVNNAVNNAVNSAVNNAVNNVVPNAVNNAVNNVLPNIVNNAVNNSVNKAVNNSVNNAVNNSVNNSSNNVLSGLDLLKAWMLPVLLIFLSIKFDIIEVIRDVLYNRLNLGFIQRDGLINSTMSAPLMITLIVLFQGVFGGHGVSVTPSAITNLVSGGHPTYNAIARLLFVFAIAYTATQSITISLYATVLFFVILYLIRTEEERANIPGGFLW